VGAGPFPTELSDATGEYLRTRGNEYGTSTGRPRRTGWFDAVVARTSVALSGAEAIAITKLDVLDDLDEIPVCVGYRLDGRPMDSLPPIVEDVARLEPVYETLGWKSKTTAVTRWGLPPAASRYVASSEAAGTPAAFIAASPRRKSHPPPRLRIPSIIASPSPPRERERSRLTPAPAATEVASAKRAAGRQG
jgi:adenylosuccinate synthase